MLPKIWKKSFNSGVVIPTKMRLCNECNNKRLCKRCNNQNNEHKDFEANLNLSERQTSNQFGHMLPYFKEQDDLFVKVRLLYTVFPSFYIIYAGQDFCFFRIIFF